VKMAYAKLGDVAPSSSMRKNFNDCAQIVWQLNLDQIEPQTGRVLTKVRLPVSQAGSSTHSFGPEHILYSKLRPYLNKVVIPEEEGIATTELVPLLPNPKRLDRRYLAHYLRSEQFVFWISNQVAGAKMPRVSMRVFWEHKIPLPSLLEQRRIVTILDRAESLLQKNKQANELVCQFLYGVFLDMFGEPVANKKKWVELPLEQGISLIESGWSAKGSNVPATQGQFGVLKISSVTSGIFRATENKAVEGGAIPLGKKLVFPNAGDLLFSRANTRELVAATALVNEDYDHLFLPDKLWKIHTNEKLLPEFLHYLVQQPRMRDRLTSKATGTSGSMLNISKKKLLDTSAIFPPLPIQRRFADIYSRTRSFTLKQRAANIEANDLFNSLSQGAFNGQL